MPQITIASAPNGLIVDAIVWVSFPRKKALESAGRPVPAAQSIRALIDTGASGTVIDKAILDQLAMPPIGNVPILTPSTGKTSQMRLQYDVGIFIPGHDVGTFVFSTPSIAVIECDFSAHGGGYNALLGIDVLAKGILHYNGLANTVTLAF